MTTEEARLTLQENFGLLSFEYPGRISEAIKIAIEVLSQPSLPSDLDEAAKQFQRRWDNDQSPEASFKAGAQWRDAQIPKLPDSIDEAAEAHRRKVYYGDSEMCQFVREVFKSGAEWMAGQGVSWEDIMTYYDGFLLYGKDERAFTMEGNFNEGDKVIVQIRKK